MNTLLTLWKHATGIPAFLVALAWMMVLITLGTIAQASMSLVEAQQTYFENPIFWLGGFLPTPGLPLILGYMAVSLVNHLVEKPLKPTNVGRWLSHAGVLLLILSGLTSLAGEYGYVVATEGTPTRLWQGEGTSDTALPSTWPTKGILPFTVTVTKFTAEFHPGTTIPKHFQSDVIITPENAPAWEATISMNAPIRTQGYTLYQASYMMPETPEAKPTSILAVVHDRTRLLPYLATFVLAVGLLAHALNRAKALFLIPLLFLSFLMPAQAGTHETQQNLSTYATLPVQHQGRIKPIATVATTAVPFILGHNVGYEESLNILRTWLANPTTLLAETPLSIPDPALQHTLKLPPTGQYSLLQLAAALAPLQETIQKLESLPPAQLAGPHKNLLSLAERADTALALARTFILFQPIHTPRKALAKALNLPNTHPLTAATLLTHREALLTLTEQAAQAKTLTPLHKEALTVATKLRSLRPELPNTLLRFIPPEGAETEWLSPWQTLQESTKTTPNQIQYLKFLLGVINKTSTIFTSPVASMGVKGVYPLPAAGVIPAQAGTQGNMYKPNYMALQLETFTLQYPPITLALIPLILALATTTIFPRLSSSILSPLALLTLTAGLLLRMIILGRVPVATLYESVLFVAWATLGMALLLRKRHPILLPTGLAFTTLLTAISHGLTQGTDTMGMLTAVLNTNFWLATHVLTITGGYAASLLTGGLALVAMAQRTLKTTPEARTTTQTWLRHLTLWAMFLTATGTLLGGIWAGQSWGRFWGWDPKENGALLLTLWLIGLAHIRMMKPVPATLWLAGAATTSIVVALSWFGVNLLNVGLHSYGFTTGLATSLALFCAGWSSLIIGLTIFNRYKNEA